MKKRQIKELDEDQLQEIEDALEQKRVIKQTTPMSKKKVIFKKDYSLTEKQKELVRMIMEPENKVFVIEGPPGSAKTFTACYAALKLYENSDVHKIYLTKPTVQVGDPLGHLPGTKEEKVNPYLESFITNFETILESSSLTSIMNNHDIDFKIVQYIRGANYKHMVMVVDEMQNFSIKELMTIVTRLSQGSKIIFCGDTRQNDIASKYVAINFFKKILTDIEGVKFFQFENDDILRDPILIKIVENYDKYEKEAPVSKNNA